MYKDKKIVVFGVSTNEAKYGYKIFAALRRLGLEVYGINPKGGMVDGQPLFATLADVPVQADVAILVIPPKALVGAVEQCAAGKVTEIWFQPGARSEESYRLAKMCGMLAFDGCFMTDNGFW